MHTLSSPRLKLAVFVTLGTLLSLLAFLAVMVVPAEAASRAAVHQTHAGVAKAAQSTLPQSASGCNQNVCIYVTGSGLHVDSWTSSAVGPVGCTTANFDAGSEHAHYKVCSDNNGNYFVNPGINRNFANGTKLCNSWDNIPGYPCETVHS